MQVSKTENNAENADCRTRAIDTVNPTAVRLTVSAQMQQMVADAAQTDSDNRLWETAASTVSTIQLRYSRSRKEGSDFEIDLHDLWFIYYQAAKNTAPESPMLDRLVLQILQTRRLGPLKRGPSAEASIASTSDGIIWTDLPFLATDMIRFWSQDWAAMTSSNRLSFATFLAKLASTGICNNRICTTGLAILSDALETPLPLGQFGEYTTNAREHTPYDATIADLLPAVNAWLYHAAYKLIQLAEHMWNGFVGAGLVGELFHNDPLFGATSAGCCSSERWIFWLKRLQQTSRDAHGAGDARLADYAAKMVDNMLLIVEKRDSTVKQKVQTSSEIVHHQPVIHQFGPM